MGRGGASTPASPGKYDCVGGRQCPGKAVTVPSGTSRRWPWLGEVAATAGKVRRVPGRSWVSTGASPLCSPGKVTSRWSPWTGGGEVQEVKSPVAGLSLRRDPAVTGPGVIWPQALSRPRHCPLVSHAAAARVCSAGHVAAAAGPGVGTRVSQRQATRPQETPSQDRGRESQFGAGVLGSGWVCPREQEAFPGHTAGHL